jgi:hypothetical protein
MVEMEIGGDGTRYSLGWIARFDEMRDDEGKGCGKVCHRCQACDLSKISGCYELIRGCRCRYRHEVMFICAGKHLSWSQRSNDQQQEHSIRSCINTIRRSDDQTFRIMTLALGEMRRVLRRTLCFPRFIKPAVSSRHRSRGRDQRGARESVAPYLCRVAFAV